MHARVNNTSLGGKGTINTLQLLVIDFYKAVYGLQRSLLCNSLGDKNEAMFHKRCVDVKQHADLPISLVRIHRYLPRYFLCTPGILFLLLLSVVLLGINPFAPCCKGKVGCLSNPSFAHGATSLGAQQCRLGVRQSAAAHISRWSLVEDHSGPLPTAPCYGRRRAIKA